MVFAIRHPVDRIYSNYKFSYETYGAKGPFDDLTEKGMANWDKFGVLRKMVTNGTSDRDIVDYYFNKSFSSGGALGVLFMHSIAFPSILHYREVLGPENVMVVNAEDLEVSDMSRVRNTLNRVFQFIGLCPYDIPDMKTALSNKNKLPLDKEMSQDVYNRLNNFFIPFNNELMRVTGFNLSHWNTKRPSSKLPLLTPGTNSSRPPLWFDLAEETTVKKNVAGHGIMSHLLPAGTSGVENGFNTTLGMLAMFGRR